MSGHPASGAMRPALARRMGRALGALVLYVALAVLLFAPAWVHPAGAWIGEAQDPKLFIWYLGWVPYALSHGVNPLFTDLLSYPQGVNLMWNTSMIFPALVLWPVTAAAGPVVSYNVLVTAGVALSAWLAFLAAGRFLDSFPLCAMVGLLYGFSPGMLAQATRHPHVMVALFPPIVVLLAHELLVRRRLHPVLIGVMGGVAASLQLMTGEELLATTALVAAIGIGLLALMHRTTLVPNLPRVAQALVASLVAFGLLSGYPLAFQFFGPQRVFGDLQTQDFYVSDLLGFLVPSHSWLQNSVTAAIAGRFPGNPSENNAYVGLPLLVLFAVGLKVNWARGATRWAGLLALITALLSLGPRLHVAGYTTPVWLPWAAVARLPLMGSVLPARLMIFAFFLVGIVVAGLWVVVRDSRRWRLAGGATLCAGLVALIPALPFVSTSVSVPPFFLPGGAVREIAVGTIVLVTPFSSKESTAAMLWQSAAGYRFRMPEGDAFTPGPYLGPHPSYLEMTLDQIDRGTSVVIDSASLGQARLDLSSMKVQTIVAGPSPGQAGIVNFLSAVVGAEPVTTGGVEVWWHVPLPLT